MMIVGFERGAGSEERADLGFSGLKVLIGIPMRFAMVRLVRAFPVK